MTSKQKEKFIKKIPIKLNLKFGGTHPNSKVGETQSAKD